MRIWVIIFIVLVTATVGAFFFYHPKAEDKKTTPSQTKTEVRVLDIPDTAFTITIPKISVVAPVIAEVDGADKNSYFKALENGVAQMKGTAMPGGGSNIVIFGHSSFYKDKPGNYKEIFKDFDKLKNGDLIAAHYLGKDYNYAVSATKIVVPADVAVVSPTPTETLTLITCWPPGSTTKRFVVVAVPK